MGNEQYALSGTGLSGYMLSNYMAYGLLCQVGRYIAPALSGVGLSGAMLSGYTESGGSLKRVNDLHISLSSADVPECQFSLVADEDNAPATGDPVVIAVGTLQAPLFRGHLVTVTRSYLAPGRLQFDCSAVGLTSDLERRTVSGTWANQYAGDILTELLGTYAPHFDTVGYVEEGTRLEEFLAQDEVLLEVCDRLASLSSFTFYVAPTREVHFHRAETLDAPWDIDDAEHYGNLEIEEDDSSLRTRIIVKYSQLRSVTDTFSGDGATVDFTMAYAPYELTALTVDGADVTYGTHYAEDNSEHDFSIDYERGVINTRAHDTLESSETLSCSYTAKIPARLTRSDADAQLERVARDGSDGVYDYVLTDRDSILSKADARAAADAQLDQYAWTQYSATYSRVEDLYGILTRMVQPGQRQSLTQWGVDEALEIQSVTISVLAPASDATLQWLLDVQLGRPEIRLDSVLSESDALDAETDYDEIIEEETR